MINVAINGFGRIGRLVLKAGMNDKNINFVAINDLTDTKTLAHLLLYDSVHGKFPYPVKSTKDSLIVKKKKIKVFAEKEPEKLPWKKLKIDVVVESTGIFRTYDDAYKHIKAGAKKVLISAPPKGNKVKTIVIGVNEKTYNKKDPVVSNASCTTNCLAPLVYVLHKKFRVERGFMATIHAYTADQKLVDSPHKDLRRGRAAALNIIPTTTGAASAINSIIPELKDKLDGIAVRVPVPDSSLTIFTADISKPASTEDINKEFKKASKTYLKNVLEYSDDHLVSSDIIGNSHSAIFDSNLTDVIGKKSKLVKVVAWYDNEYGYSCRMIDVIKHIMRK